MFHPFATESQIRIYGLVCILLTALLPLWGCGGSSSGSSGGNPPTNGTQESRVFENFEDDQLEDALAVYTTGSFAIEPDIRAETSLNGAMAFGFGKSTCGASCSSRYASSLFITLPEGSQISEVSFDFMELDGDWGSVGGIFIDDELVELFRPTTNTGVADTAPQTYRLEIDQATHEVEIRVWDITTRSELYIDDLEIAYASAGGSPSGDTLEMRDLTGNWRITVETGAYDTSSYHIDVNLNAGGTLSYTEYMGGSVLDADTGSWSYNASSRHFYAEGDGDLCSGTISAGASANAFSVPGTFYGATATYHWVRR